MSATARTNWFWSDWLGDQAVRRLTPAERGVWIDLLALAAAANPIGYVCDEKGRALTLDEIARVTNAGSVDEVSKLITGILDKGAASRDRAGRLFNRRMVRDAEVSAKRRLAGTAGGKSTQLKWQSFQTVPEQKAWQVPQQRVGPPIHLSKLASSSVAPRGKQTSASQPARSLASALPTGALAREACTEPVEGQEGAIRPKPPAAMTRQELDDLYARKPTKAAG